MTKVLVQARISRAYRDRAREVLEDIGLDVTTAFEIFLKTVTRERKIPFVLEAGDPHDI